MVSTTISDAGEYTDSCARYAKKLYRAADEFDSAKSNLESACNPYYGYNKDDESACGTYGYERSGFESAASELEYALGKVSRFCGTCQNPCQGIVKAAGMKSKKLEATIDELKLKIKQLESLKDSSNPK